MAGSSRAPFAQSQHRRPGSRIVPAIPYRLSKAQPSVRPLTPEESNKGAPAPATDVQAKEQQAGEKQQEQHQHQQSEKRPAVQETTTETPPTPDSRASGDPTEADAGVSPSDSRSAEQTNGQTDAADPSDNQNHAANGHTSARTRAPRDEHKPAGNGVHRKLTIPTYLPPPFVPSSKATQTPPVDGSDAMYTPLHPPQFNGGAVASHSANESPALPMSPHEANVDIHGQHALPRPPPGFGPQQFTPFFPGPAQYAPETGATWHLPPHTVAPPEPVYQNGIDYHVPHFSGGPQAYPTPYNGHFSPREAALTTNGILTSHAQSPSKGQFETMPAIDHADEQHAIAHQDSNAPPEERVESSFELAGYLSSQFGNPELADFILQVRSPESVLLSLPVHGIVVIRSPVIAEAVRCSPAPAYRDRDARPLVHVLALDPLATRDSLEEAIRVLYGAPLIRPQGFLYGLEPFMYENQQTSPSPEARRRMQQVLGYIAAARTFQIPSMQARGIHTAKMLLRWDTVDLVLQYALRSRLRQRPEGPDVDAPFATALISQALEFIAYFFPSNFKLHTIAPELKDAPRLPTLTESRQPAHNPRLSKIRFGDAPPEDDLQPSYSTLVLSTILLSLPLSLIEGLFNQAATVTNRIGWKDVTNHLRDIVNERENRRQKALRCCQPDQSQPRSIPATLLNNLYVEEILEQVEPSPLHPSGYQLTTKRVTGEA
ncbi:hypothetical protein yc1106_00904 [Curvularia clavata]|uniref:Uncharacterized protein n=1 Tax=Curvularia clavata TaxID=95742 RepID=A0A9Q9DNY1_CURCL|nr:hypothetical protein yc1106_00904 [Curvularia clavata]